ncbi:MAG TPA: tetratricopeptide repeat protein [Pirellulales bacterium]|nr:tetratricopeptide repeat protein [Pirellulales bacterium]
MAAATDDSSTPASWSLPAGLDASVPAGGQREVYWVWAVCVFLLLAVGLVFGQTVDHEFLGFDDQAFVYENPHVSPGVTLSGLWWALTDGHVGEAWYPLSAVSHMLDCQLYGLSPGGHYLTNVLLHAASSVLLFLVLLRMTGDFWPSAWVAAVFAVHPLHVESVAWLAERRDVLSGLFFMLTLGAYALYAERPSLARYLAVAGCFALGMTAKPMLVTAPFVLLLLDYWPLDRFRRRLGAGSLAASGRRAERLPVGWRLMLEKIPLMALAASGCAVVVLTRVSRADSYAVERLSLGTRVANAVVAYASYVGQSFYPACLAPFYPHPATNLPTTSVAGALALLVAVSAVAAYCWRRLPYLLVGWLWFLGMLVPVIGLVQLGSIAQADRYTYLSQIGLSLALAWGVESLYRSRQTLRRRSWRRWALAAVAGGAVLGLAGIAWRQTSYWRNAETLWTHTLSCTRQNLLAHHGLAIVYARQGRTEQAIAEARNALAAGSIDRRWTAEAHILLARKLREKRSIDEALTHYEQAVQALPQNQQFHYQLADALAAAGKFDRAVAEWRVTLRMAPSVVEVRLGLADALLAQGKAGEAIAQCREILEKDPKAIHALVILGEALAADGQTEQAIAALKRALALEPRYARAHRRLGLILYDRGKAQDAMTHFNTAIRLEPDSLPTLCATAWILATSPDPSVRDGARAVELARRAIELPPGGDPRAYDTLAAALAEVKDFSAAVGAAKKAATMALIRDDSGVDEAAIERRIRLYRQGLPYREPGSPLPAHHAPPSAE